MRNPFDNTPPQPPRSIVSLPIQLLYALFSSYPLFTVPLLSLSLSRSLCFQPLPPPPLPDSPCSAGGVTPLARSLVLVPISSRRSCPICPAPVLCTEEKGRHGFAVWIPSPLFRSRVGCVGSGRDASELETRDTARNPLRTDE